MMSLGPGSMRDRKFQGLSPGSRYNECFYFLKQISCHWAMSKIGKNFSEFSHGLTTTKQSEYTYRSVSYNLFSHNNSAKI